MLFFVMSFGPLLALLALAAIANRKNATLLVAVGPAIAAAVLWGFTRPNIRFVGLLVMPTVQQRELQLLLYDSFAWLVALPPLLLLWHGLWRLPRGKPIAAFFFLAFVVQGVVSSEAWDDHIEERTRSAKLAAVGEKKKDAAYLQKIETEMAACEADPENQCWTPARNYEFAHDFATALRFYRVCCDEGKNMCCSFGRSTEDKLLDATRDAEEEAARR